MTILRLGEGILDTGVVQDGNIITSGICPAVAKYNAPVTDETPELTQKLIDALGASA